MATERFPTPDHLAWLDLEMTGLDPNHDVILQAGLIITTRDLAPLEEYACDIWQSDEALVHMVPFVRNMHESTGLLTRVRASTTDLVAAEKQLLERVAGWCSYPAILCGNTIGQDRKFLEKHMPGLHGYLHYRSLDVTSLKLLAGLWFGPDAVFMKPEAGTHDALVDINRSIAELSHYRNTLFRSS